MSLDGNTTAAELSGKIKDIDVLCLSAYAIAVKNGFEGTEEEWLASLMGAKGDKGEIDTESEFVFMGGSAESAADIEILSKDYIVEQGKSGIWTYRKWASGIAECWGDIIYQGYIYDYTQPKHTISAYNSFPFPFIERPSVTYGLSHGAGWHHFVAWTEYTSEAFENFDVLCLSDPDGNELTGVLSTHVKGRWK